METRLFCQCILGAAVAHSVWAGCARDKSKIVRRIIQEDIVPLYDYADAHMPAGCPFHLDRDMYSIQENHKVQENPSKWVCDFCGKTFYEEHFLDQHFDNRHPQSIKRDSSTVCLADFCDIFRCDVVSGKVKSKYWDIALCKEPDLQNQYNRCQKMLKQCLPSILSSEEKEEFLNKFQKILCNFLNCENYWDLHHDEMNPVGMAVYILAGMLLMLGLLVYYYVAYTHFYTDESLIDSLNDNDTSPFKYGHPLSSVNRESRNEIRHRWGQSSR